MSRNLIFIFYIGLLKHKNNRDANSFLILVQDAAETTPTLYRRDREKIVTVQ